MRAQTVDVKSSTGRILCCTVFRPGGKKLLAKGHVISDEDIRVLAAPILRHRILLNFHAESERLDSDAILKRLLDWKTEPK